MREKTQKKSSKGRPRKAEPLLITTVGKNEIVVEKDPHNWIVKLSNGDPMYFSSVERVLGYLVEFFIRHRTKSLEFKHLLETILEAKADAESIGRALDRKVRIK